jgi:hypothetical protein
MYGTSSGIWPGKSIEHTLLHPNLAVHTRITKVPSYCLPSYHPFCPLIR